MRLIVHKVRAMVVFGERDLVMGDCVRNLRRVDVPGSWGLDRKFSMFEMGRSEVSYWDLPSWKSTFFFVHVIASQLVIFSSG